MGYPCLNLRRVRSNCVPPPVVLAPVDRGVKLPLFTATVSVPRRPLSADGPDFSPASRHPGGLALRTLP